MLLPKWLVDNPLSKMELGILNALLDDSIVVEYE